jgi:3-hydroxyacyl-CoA dehydrogenase/enoyl-CoA hydratase/3-hydroxybutyryl-CoA epimerase
MTSPTSAFTFTIENGIAHLVFDLPGEKANKLTSSVMQEFSTILDTIAKTSTVKALLIKSAKPDIFIAGADIAEIRDIVQPKDAEEKAKSGQTIFNQLQQFPMPTIALINGACLGGGMELALACTYRIATDHPKTILGLPEVNLGILPGFGGTQRLPKLIGAERSLDLILTGKSVPGPKAEKLGMVDGCFPTLFAEAKTLEFIQTILTPQGKAKVLAKRKQKGFKAWFLNKSWVGTRITFSVAKKQIMSKTKGVYPAPLAALSAVKYGYFKSLKSGLAFEAKQFGILAPGAISKNLVGLFFIQEDLKKNPGTTSSISPYAVQRTGVLGAGLMGGGIAWMLSSVGISVRLKDIEWQAIGRGYAAAYKLYEKLFKRKKITASELSLGMHRITGTTEYYGFSKTQVVIEAILEDMSLKKKVFAELETKIAQDTIVASNTSALSITEMASAFKRPERFIGMHFFSPVNMMPLVEIIPGPLTSPQTIATVVQLAKTMKKTPIVIKDCPGFLVNRLLIPYVNEAVLLLEEGVSVKTIDSIMEKFGMPLGPLALADEVGLDVGYKVAKILENGYGPRMKVASTFDTLYAQPDIRGKKTGKGFYIHSGKKKCPNPKLKQWISRSKGKQPKAEECLDRLVLGMVNEAAKCLEEAVVNKPSYLDMAMILGTGFPPFRGGLCRYADHRGIQDCLKKLEVLHKAYGARFEPAGLLISMAKNQKTFY